MAMDWFRISNEEVIDSPALLIYQERLEANIRHAIDIAGGAERLRPHIKTHKLAPVIQLHLDAGIKKFKCATIAEAEVLASTGARDILLAYQPVGPKIQRLRLLMQQFPGAAFSALVDDIAILEKISTVFSDSDQPLGIFLDLDVGMHRSGIAPGEAALAIYQQIENLPGVFPAGLHVYDGHIRLSDFDLRKQESDEAFEKVTRFLTQLHHLHLPVPEVVAGGTPTFPVHAQRPDVTLSPGTYVFWDAGYQEILPDLPFLPAAVLLTRVISKPQSQTICLDLGHKAVAAEKPHPRMDLLGVQASGFPIHSEEHLVVESPDAPHLSVGDVLYAIPRHICPTVALHQRVYVVDKQVVYTTWEVRARNRQLSI